MSTSKGPSFPFPPSDFPGGGGGGGLGFRTPHFHVSEIWYWLWLDSMLTRQSYARRHRGYYYYDDDDDYNYNYRRLPAPGPSGGGGGGLPTPTPSPPPPPPPTITDLENPTGDNNRQQQRLSFFDTIFSFLWGDGNPNRKREKRLMRAIASFVSSQSGVVTAEQVAPYLDEVLFSDNSGSANDSNRRNYHEEHMLKVLSMLAGVAEASDDGRLAYIFPHFITAESLTLSSSLSSSSSSSSSSASTTVIDPPPIMEAEWKFSKIKGEGFGWAIGLGLVNLLEVIFLGALLLKVQTAEAAGEQLLPNDDQDLVVALVRTFLPYLGTIWWILLVYAVTYFVIPLVRYLFIQFLNEGIRKRNQQRRERVEALMTELNTSPSIQDKIAVAKTEILQRYIDSVTLVEQ